MNRKRLILGIAGVVAAIGLGAVSYGAYVRAVGPMSFAGGTPVGLADYRGGTVTGAAEELAGASPVARGEYLVRAADCAPCHSAPGKDIFAGGRAFPLPFGTIYSSNITPDPKNGIGNWTDEQFIAAVKHGKRRDGTNLYPAMPYPTFQQITDEDARAMRAYLATIKPVASAAPTNQLSFPFNKRGLMGLWNYFFIRKEAFKPVAERSREWNRGAYLAEALGHCAECHTPRGLSFALDNRQKFAGAETNGWEAHNITSSKQTGIGSWGDAELSQYLSNGLSGGKGVAIGPMGEAVDHGTRFLTDKDRAALVAYLRTVPSIDNNAARRTAALGKGFAHSLDGSAGERLFTGNCAGCHDWTGKSPYAADANLIGLSAVNSDRATNIVQVILFGADRTIPNVGAMPAFAQSLSDEEVAAVTNYVTARYGSQPSKVDAAAVKKIRTQGAH